MEWVRLSLAPGWQLVSGMCMGAASRDDRILGAESLPGLPCSCFNTPCPQPALLCVVQKASGFAPF